MFGWYVARFIVFLGTQEECDLLASFPSSREKISQPGITPPSIPFDFGYLFIIIRWFKVISDLARFIIKKDVSHNKIEIKVGCLDTMGGALFPSCREQIQKIMSSGAKVPNVMNYCSEEGEVLKSGGAHLHEGNFKSICRMREASTKIIEHNISKYDQVSMISRTRKILPIPLL